MAVARDDDASDDSSKELDSPKTRAAKELQARMARLTEEQEAKRREAKMSEPSGMLRSERMCMVQLIVQSMATPILTTGATRVHTPMRGGRLTWADLSMWTQWW